MAVAAAGFGGYLPSKLRCSPPKTATQNRAASPAPPPLYISTRRIDVNPLHLRDLFSLCNRSCHRFPNLDSAGRVETVDLAKLQIAISHSAVVVSVFAKRESASQSSSSQVPNELGRRDEWIRRAAPVTPANGHLVGFGRAVSDLGLTAAIYDVMVVPYLQGRGIGKMIVQRLVRYLTNKGIYDIAALCSDEEKQFFAACGFGEDILGSTTMMYTKSPLSNSTGDDEMIKSAGRMLLLAPPLRGRPKLATS